MLPRYPQPRGATLEELAHGQVVQAIRAVEDNLVCLKC